MNDMNYMNDMNHNAPEQRLGMNDQLNLEETRILPKGEYDFQVIGMERVPFKGSEKMEPGEQIALTLRVCTDRLKTAICRDWLILNKKARWKLTSFFQSILVLDDSHYDMDWSQVQGAYGRAMFAPSESRDGRVFNNVTAYLEKETDGVPEVFRKLQLKEKLQPVRTDDCPW